MAHLNTIANKRIFKFTPQEIFTAFQDPSLLAKWWGPKDFTNTFEVFEFQVGGQWVYVMHGPNGKDYPNESIFREISAHKIVIEHVVLPKYTLTIVFTPQAGGTLVEWNQEFENQTFVKNMKDFLNTANEQNFDRLQSILEIRRN